ncbi:MAG: DUF3127 domain-containing protein [Rikenellaceae bacterium]
MEFEGKVLQINPVTSGTSARGEWQRQDVIFEIADGSFPRKVCVTFFNKPNDVAQIKVGASYIVSINISSREYNSRWYTDIMAWRVQPKMDEMSQIPPESAPSYAPPAPAAPSYSAGSSEVDDLPF